MGAFLGNERVADVFTPGTHCTTFGGNPVACAAGLATVHEILHGGVMENAATIGFHLMNELEQLRVSMPDLIAEVRGKGMMVGLDLRFDGTEVIDRLMEKRVLLNLTNTTVVRWLPPLNTGREEIDVAVQQVASTLAEMKNTRKLEPAAPVFERP